MGFASLLPAGRPAGAASRGPGREPGQGVPVDLDPEARAFGYPDHAARVLDGLTQQRLPDRVLGAVELEHGLDGGQRAGVWESTASSCRAAASATPVPQTCGL